MKKLGIKDGYTSYFFDAPLDYFKWIAPLPEIEVKNKLAGELDFIHLFVSSRKDFESMFGKSKEHLKKDGMLWVSGPKKTSNVETDLDENVIREFALQGGLVDVKVCAVSEVWSGLKFVIRVKDR